ncbi:gliding motility protein GldM [Fulvivirgaceae bacterium BMA10]|uniref:Gliding motility protein GldM n=1 Tax=Splendidivirga corallicola TaxID=3051826 RepID=A0ABT8KV52_9BACT|nr:gliding motility protein GldM [Fulvivirgaceae bacterium BMA10]
MAGAKETPRQRMIGMMYLVLTALLALQVSNSVLQKFIFINDTLEQSVLEGSTGNSGTVDRIKAAVDKAGNRNKDVAVLDKAQQIRNETSAVLSKLDGYKKLLIDVTKAKNEDGTYNSNIKNEEKVANLMLNQKKGNEIKDVLNGYAEFLTKTSGMSFDAFALDAKDDPAFANDKNQNKKKFDALYFETTPMGAALAQLSEFQSKVINKEAQALDKLARDVGAEDVKFDNIVAMVRPESNVVAAGARYKAEMFIAASSSGITPTMKKDGQEIKVENGKGLVEFTATPGNYDKEGLARKTFTAEIAIPGKDTVYTSEIEYFVARPVIEIQSAALQALYLGCGNELQVNVPALGTSYDPAFTVTGGSSIKGQTRGLVTIVPNAKNVELTVRSGGNLIGTKKFTVKPIPPANIKLKTRGKEVNQKTGETISNLRSLDIQAIAEDGFAQLLPKDARYRVTKWTIRLARGSRAVGQPIKATKEKVNLSNLMRNARSGDRLSIEINELKRLNFKGQTEVAKVNSKYINVPLN